MADREEIGAIKERIRSRLVDDAPALLVDGSVGDQRFRIREVVRKVLADERIILPTRDVLEIVSEISDEVAGLGPLEVLMRDPEVTELMINGPKDVFVERRGRLSRVDIQLESDEQITHLVERVIGPLGLRIDESRPFVEARLPDGGRIHAIIPPLSIKGPAVTIRKFSIVPFTYRGLIEMGSLSEDMARFCERAVKQRKSIIVSGGTGSGKTTLLNLLSSSIPEGERLVSIEEAAELRLEQENVVSLEARPDNVEGTGAVGVRQLVRNALRMRPDRIIVGEVRGEEALDMIQAMNTGHEGSLSTCHANSPEDLLSRLETMVMMSDLGLAQGPVRNQIAAAIDLVIQLERFEDGARRVVRICDVAGIEGDSLKLKNRFTFDRSTGRFVGRSQD